MLTLSQAGVIAAYGLMIVSNVISTATTIFNGTDNAKIARENPTYVSPDGVTFSIWGFIYLFETFLVIYQALPGSADVPELKGQTRKWLTLAFLLNAIWLPIFSYHRWWLSLLVIVGYLAALYKTYKSLGVHYGKKKLTDVGDDAATKTKIFAFTGVSLNFAWVFVATILNFTIVSRNSGIIVTSVTTGNITSTTSGSVSPLYKEALVGGNVDWAIAAVVVAAGIGCYRAVYQCDVPYTFVTAWALSGIYRMQTYATDVNFPLEAKSHDLATWAITLALVVSVCGVFALGRAVYELCSSAKYAEDNDGSASTLSRRLSSGTRV